METQELVEKYFRPGRLPHIWCPGCGNGIITGAIVKAVDKLLTDKLRLMEALNDEERKTIYTMLYKFIGKKKLKDALSNVLHDVHQKSLEIPALFHI